MHVVPSLIPLKWSRLRVILQSHLPVVALYGVLAIALLAPMASNSILPSEPDHANHVGIIVQAKLALDEGQFPIRVAPRAHNGWQYPLFQFYSPLPYTAAALVYRWITPDNPFLAYKLMLAAALVIGGVFIYLTAGFLTRSRPAAVLAGVAYMSAPYVLVNIHARGAFTEALAQGLLPVVIYCTLRCYFTSGFSPWFFACGLSWGMLALTHSITYVCASLFVGLFMLMIDVRRWRISFALVRTGAAFVTGILLAMYFLAPMVTADYLNILDTMSVSWTRFFTPLSGLLSPISLPSEPQPGHPTVEHLNPNVGWPALLGMGMLAYACWQRWELARVTGPRPRRFGVVLVILFVIAFVLTWSPVDFWPYTPTLLRIAQFTFRWLAQVVWIAALALAYAIVWLFRGKLERPHVIVGTMLIVMAHASFLPPLKSSPVTVADIVKRPDIGYGQLAYLANPKAAPDPAHGSETEAQMDLIPAIKSGPLCARLGTTVKCHFTIATRATNVELPLLFYPKLLDVRINGTPASYFPLRSELYLLTSVRLEPGVYDVTGRFQGLPWANATSALAWIGMLAGLLWAIVRRARPSLPVKMH